MNLKNLKVEELSTLELMETEGGSLWQAAKIAARMISLGWSNRHMIMENTGADPYYP